MEFIPTNKRGLSQLSSILRGSSAVVSRADMVNIPEIVNWFIVSTLCCLKKPSSSIAVLLHESRHEIIGSGAFLRFWGFVPYLSWFCFCSSSNHQTVSILNLQRYQIIHSIFEKLPMLNTFLIEFDLSCNDGFTLYVVTRTSILIYFLQHNDSMNPVCIVVCCKLCYLSTSKIEKATNQTICVVSSKVYF